MPDEADQKHRIGDRHAHDDEEQHGRQPRHPDRDVECHGRFPRVARLRLEDRLPGRGASPSQDSPAVINAATKSSTSETSAGGNAVHSLIGTETMASPYWM